MNPRGPASALRPGHYSREERKLPVPLRLSERPAHTRADHDCGSYGVAGVPAQHLLILLEIPGELNQAVPAIWINKHKRAGT